MSSLPSIPALPSAQGVRTRLASPAVLLTLIVVAGAAVRLALALGRTMPRYLPDEYLYPQLARSIADGGGIAVLGQHSTFPALLEPVLLAPIWSVLDPQWAITVTQALHSLLMALAAVPVFHLARQLRLTDRAALVCAAIAVVAPGMFFASLMTADALGYLLALLAVTIACRSLAVPSTRSQVVFLLSVGLASAARVQYAVLLPIYVLAAPVVERSIKRALHRHALVVGLTGLGLAGGLLAGSTVLGRYSTIASFGASSDTVRWALSGTFLLAVATGVALAPGALAWATSTIRRPSDRDRSAFAAFGLGFAIVMLAVASVMTVETTSDRFLERYLITAAPLSAIAFCCWLADGRPGRLLAAAAGLILVVVAARAPLASYTGAQGVADSPTLLALSRVEDAVGVANASLVAAAIVTIGAGAAVAAALMRGRAGGIALASAAVLLVAISMGAHVTDGKASDGVRRSLFSADPSWVDAALTGDALLVQTADSHRFDAMLTSLMNSSVRRAAALGTRGVDPFDGLEPTRLTIGRDGRLLEAGRPVTSPVVWAIGGGIVTFDDARVVLDRRFVLAVPREEVRVGVLTRGIRWDGKVSQNGRIVAFPTRAGRCMRFTATLRVPAGVPATTIETRVDGATRVLVITAGQPATLVVTASRDARALLTYRTLTLGDRVPTPLDGTVADARYTSESVSCDGSQGT